MSIIECVVWLFVFVVCMSTKFTKTQILRFRTLDW